MVVGHHRVVMGFVDAKYGHECHLQNHWIDDLIKQQKNIDISTISNGFGIINLILTIVRYELLIVGDLNLEKDVALLKDCLENRSPVLFLGAGFSLGAKGKNGHNLMLGGSLAEQLYNKIILPRIDLLPRKAILKANYAKELPDLQVMCDVLRENELLDERNSCFKDSMSDCTYADSPYYSYLLNIDWKYIFTLNIDDLVEHIYEDAGKPLICWKSNPLSYKEDLRKTVLVKLHGDVSDSSTYIFDKNEYQKFSSQDNWMLRKFAGLYVSHDVIIIGTQFQEYDIEIALQKVFEYGCDNTNFHYFFISPGNFDGKVGREISIKKNFHHIKWNTEQFLNFLENEVSKPQDAIQRLCAQGITFWNKALEDAQNQREDCDLYYGKPSEPTDFYYNVDIPQRRIQEKIENFIQDISNAYGYIEIKGSPYVGKTCVAKRALTFSVELRFKSFYCAKTDLRYLQIIRQYLETVSTDDSILLCFEDASGFYRQIINLVNEHRSHIKRLLTIMTTSDVTQGPNNYIFASSPFLGIHMNEKINSTLANSIYDKLDEKTQLGKLLTYGEGKRSIVKYIRQINDFIDVLYIAHHGKRFSEYFDGWLSIRKEDEQFPVFQSVVLLTSMGIPYISISYLPDIAEALGCKKFDYSSFLNTFGEFGFAEDGLLRLRCSRLFSDIVMESLSIEFKTEIVKNIVYLVSKDLWEGDRTFKNEMFKHLIRASVLKHIVGLSEETAIQFLIELQEFCKDLSYYWIQLGILHRNCQKFELAENDFEYAKKAHGCENYQIAHASAKNYMEWGLWALTNVPSQSASLFEEGAENMGQLILRWPYPDAICFSAHTYIDMNIKYYDKLNQVPPESTWKLMNTCMVKYVYNASVADHLLRDLFMKMCQFAKKNTLQIERITEMEDVLKRKDVWPASTTEYWEIDEDLPVYDEKRL